MVDVTERRIAPSDNADGMTEPQGEQAVKILRNFQRMYLAHLIERQAVPMTDPIFILTDALYAATTDAIGPPPTEEPTDD